MFIEISPELAQEIGVSNGDWVIVATIRGAIETRALVTRRIRPLHLQGEVIHQVALPFHFGSLGHVRGGSANDLIGLSGDPNVMIQESKALTCALIRGRLPPEKEFGAWFGALNSGVMSIPPRHREESPKSALGAVSAGHGEEAPHGEEGKV
jgi:formate dehydrogenase major subunit